MLNRHGTTCVLTALSIGVAGLTFVGGCASEPVQPFDPRTMQQTQRQAAAEPSAEARQIKRPLPTQLESPFLPGAPDPATVPPPTTGPSLADDAVVRLSLREVIQRTVANNLDVKVEGYNPAIEETRVVEAEARFDPTFFANVGVERTDRAIAGTPNIFGPTLTQDERWGVTAQTGLRQFLETGGQVELRYQAGYTRAKPDGRFDPNPFYESDLVLQITQPLLRDFGRDVNRARITINRNNQRISLLQFRQSLEEVLTQTEQVYWQLVAAERDVQILEQLLADTVRTAEVLFLRRGQDVTRVQLSQANASVESRRALLIRAKSRVRDLSDQLKRLMNDPSMPVTGGTLVLPSSTPVEAAVNYDLQDLIATALESRPELGAQQLRVESTQVARQVARNNLQPSLNVVGSLGVQGLGGNFGDAVSDQFDFDNISYGVGLQLEIPIGNRAARSLHRRAMLQQQQAMTAYQNTIDQIALDVKIALREVNTTYNEIVAQRQARLAAADALQAIIQREEANEPLTPTFVQLKLDTQARLVDTQQAENQAVAAYNIAIARLERAKGTLLRYNNVVLEEESRALGR